MQKQNKYLVKVTKTQIINRRRKIGIGYKNDNITDGMAFYFEKSITKTILSYKTTTEHHFLKELQ